MNLSIILSDPTLKGVKRRQAVVDYLLANDEFLMEVSSLLSQLDERQTATILEAIEEVSNKNIKLLREEYLHFAEQFVCATNNSCKRESSRIIGNLCARFPQSLSESMPLLFSNTKDPGTVVRWSAAYALSRIVVLPNYAKSDLYDTLVAIEAKEEEPGVKSQYTKALKKAAKLRAQ